MELVSDSRLAMQNNRVLMFKEPALISEDGDIDYKAGVYSVASDAKGTIKMLLHRPTGDQAEVEDEYHIKKGE